MRPGSTCFLGKTPKTDGKHEYCESRGSQVEVAFADLNSEEGKKRGEKRILAFKEKKNSTYLNEGSHHSSS